MSQSRARIKPGRASLIGGIAVAIASFVLWAAVTHELGVDTPGWLVVGLLVAGGVGTWIRVADFVTRLTGFVSGPIIGDLAQSGAVTMPLELIETAELSLSDARWQARVDLAAAHRLAVMHGFHEGIFNHFTLRVPGTNDRYYQIPFGLHWSEVTASCFMEVGYDGTRLSGEGEIERSAYCIHAPIHRLNARAAAVFHTHMPYASALARLEDQSILPIGQTELGTLMHTAYDDIYTGPAFDPAEGERLAEVIGDKTVLMMANHGVATVGASVSEAYDRLYYVERVAQVQLYAMWTNRPLKHLPQNVVDHTLGEYRKNSYQYGGKPNHVWHFDALKRVLDRKEPDYKD